MIDDDDARDNFLKDVCTFLRKFSRIPFGVTPKDIQELMSKLLEDVPKAITPDEPSEEPKDPLIMGEEELSTILEKVKSSVEDLIQIPKGFSDDICDNDHFEAESLLSQDIPITSPKIDFLSEEFTG
ncbi:hypothetical protein Tco_0320136 [Tanacetum coccineum]